MRLKVKRHIRWRLRVLSTEQIMWLDAQFHRRGIKHRIVCDAMDRRFGWDPKPGDPPVFTGPAYKVEDGNVVPILSPLRQDAEYSEYVHDRSCPSPGGHEGPCLV